MSTLRLYLIRAGETQHTLLLTAEVMIETTLSVTPGRASLPTLISVENIVGQINSSGYELGSRDEINKIASLVNTYYLPTTKSSWSDRELTISVVPIQPEYLDVYHEIQDIREEVIRSSRDVIYYEQRNNHDSARRAEDRAVECISTSIRKRRKWWEGGTVIRFLFKTAIPIIFDALIGIPLSVLVRSILGRLIDAESDHA